MRFIRYIGIALVLALGLCGCRPSGNLNTASSTYPRVAVTSCTHVGFLQALGCLDAVVAATNIDLIYTPLPDSVIDLGDALSPSVEQLLLADVDVVFASSYTQNTFAKQVEQMGIKVVYVDEWKEPTPLQRLAWIRCFGQIMHCPERADSICQAGVAAYRRVAGQADSLQRQGQCSLMTGNNFRGTWYVPSGNTYMGNLFADAGALYPYYANRSGSSLPLSIEQIVRDFQQADVWVGCSARTLAELVSQDEAHTWFKSYQQGRVYNWLRQSTPQGANNFWERGVVHPEEILSDLLLALYPDDWHADPHYIRRLD